jgi:transcriptional regulator with XRE-family HTH domain
MPKTPNALTTLPPAVAAALQRLGENLAIARVRRKQSQRVWAQRLGVSVPTLIRLEQGDPGVSAGIYATALWLVGQVQALPELADPARDRGALEMDVREAAQRRAVRSAASVQARLGRGGRSRASGEAPAAREPAPPTTDPPPDLPPAAPPPRRRTAGG